MTNIAERATAGTTPEVHQLPDRRRTGGEVLNAWSALNDRVDDLGREVTNGYQGVRRRQMDERTTVIAQQEPRALLDELATQWGLSWAIIARLVGVSAAAVRKWRRGESITGDNRRAIARVIAFLENTAQSLNPVSDATSWLEMPISDATDVSGVDVFVAGHWELLLDLAAERVSPHDVLDALDPDWREKSEQRFVVEDAPDGLPAIIEVDKAS